MVANRGSVVASSTQNRPSTCIVSRQNVSAAGLTNGEVPKVAGMWNSSP